MVDQSFNTRNGLGVGDTLFVVNSATGRVGVNTATPSVSLHINATDQVSLPVGNTSQRGSGANGHFRYNRELGAFEGFANGGWVQYGAQVVGGGNTQIQFNDTGALNAVSIFTFDKATGILTVGNATVGAIVLGGGPVINASGFFSTNVTASSRISIGNTTVNTSINSTAIVVASISGLTALAFGNSTVNSIVNSTFFQVSNSGGTASISPSGFTVGTATHTINSFYVGNSTVNAVMSQTTIAVGNSTVNSTMTNNTFSTPSLGVGTPPSGVTGEIRALNNITSYFSDDRLKKNIERIKDPIAKIRKLKGVTYERNELAVKFGVGYDGIEHGLLAGDVYSIMPDAAPLAVFDDKGDGVSISGENYRTTRPERIIALLVEVVNAQQDMLEEILKRK